MIEIKTLDDFNGRVKNFRSQNGKALTNCFLMPDETAKLVSEGKMFFEEYPGWLLILCDRDDYYSLFYYACEESDAGYVKDFIKTVKAKDVYADIVSRGGRGDMLTPEKLIKEGAAEKYKVYQRMQLNIKDTDFSDVIINLPEGYSVSEKFCDSEELNRLWKEALDEKSTPLPKEDELRKLLNEGHLFTVLDSENSLAAVTVLSVTGRQGLIQHVSVSKEHRRKGLAAALMNRCLLAASKEELTALRLWVDCENTSAIALYDRFGFEKDGMICDQLYMKGF